MTFRPPPRRWLLRWTGGLAALYALALGTGLLNASSGLHRLDEALFRNVNGLDHGPGLLWEVLNPDARNYVLLTVFAVAVAAVTAPRRIPRVLTLVLSSALLSWGLLEGISNVYDRPRPEEALHPATILLDGHSWGHVPSFPSGHMVITAALAGATMLAFPRLRSVLWSYVLAVAFTRVLFGAHFPLDVVVGTILGYASAWATFVLLREVGLLEPRAEPGRQPCTEPASAACPQTAPTKA